VAAFVLWARVASTGSEGVGRQYDRSSRPRAYYHRAKMNSAARTRMRTRARARGCNGVEPHALGRIDPDEVEAASDHSASRGRARANAS
jgi:hypothetical protein